MLKTYSLAFFSTHTAFPAPARRDLSDFARPVLDHWQSIGAEFGGILTGYLANAGQAELALELIDRFGRNALVIQDPAMADHGRLYSGLGPELVEAHRRICARADLVIPNLTEGCMLAGVEYEDRMDLEFCRQIATALLKTARAVLLTGYSPSPDTVGFYYSDGKTEFAHAAPRLPRNCHGTGDVYASAFVGALVQGKTAFDAARIAADYTVECIKETAKHENHWYGAAFEPVLGKLIQALN